MVILQRKARGFSPIPLDYTPIGDTQTAAEHDLAQYWTRVFARYANNFFGAVRGAVHVTDTGHTMRLVVRVYGT